MRPVFINHKYIGIGGTYNLQSWYVLEQVVEISKTEETSNWEVLICQGFIWQVIPTYLPKYKCMAGLSWDQDQVSNGHLPTPTKM